MKVTFRAAEIYLVVDQPTKAVANRRNLTREHRRVRNHDDVGRKQRRVLPDELVEMQASDLFFPFEKDLDVQRQASGLLHVGLDRLEVHEDLPLVVGGASRVDL